MCKETFTRIARIADIIGKERIDFIWVARKDIDMKWFEGGKESDYKKANAKMVSKILESETLKKWKSIRDWK